MKHMTAVMILAATFLAFGHAQAGNAILVCIRTDGVLRLAEGPCRPGETKRLFAEWEPDSEESPAEQEGEQNPLQKKLQDLTRRVAALENERASTRITAPFEVVGRNGSIILRVAEKVSSTSGDGAHVTIGAGESGNYGLRVHNKGGPLAAGIGQSREGTGVIVVMDGAGMLAANMNGGARRISVFDGEHAVASMGAESGGTVAVYDGPQPVAYLTRSSHGKGGNVTLATSEGFGVFSAGAASDGGGEACLNRVTGGGKQRNVCLGVELPSMGLGK